MALNKLDETKMMKRQYDSDESHLGWPARIDALWVVIKYFC